MVETPKENRWEVCLQGAAGPMGKATTQARIQGQRTGRLCPQPAKGLVYDAEKVVAPLWACFPMNRGETGLGWGASAVRSGRGGSLTDPPRQLKPRERPTLTWVGVSRGRRPG